MENLVVMRQRGFTLIEMSIVLVIIGLIVGGILKGQELIESARQKNLISQIDQIKSGVTTFTDRFKSYPGDFGRASSVLSNNLADGNDNGQVGDLASGTASLVSLVDATGTNENVGFWSHLLAANAVGGGSVIDKSVNPSNFSGTGSNPSPLPSSAYPQSGLSVMYGTHEGDSSSTSSVKQGHWLILHRWIGTGALTVTQAAISPTRSFQLDNKYDDGAPNNGNIRSLFVGTGCGATGVSTYGSTSDTQCVLAFALE